MHVTADLAGSDYGVESASLDQTAVHAPESIHPMAGESRNKQGEVKERRLYHGCSTWKLKSQKLDSEDLDLHTVLHKGGMTASFISAVSSMRHG